MMKTLLLAASILALSISTAFAQVYSADFSNEGDGIPDHTTTVPPAAGPFSIAGGTAPNNWTVGYTSTPGTDGTVNEFSVNSGVLRIQDFGGTGSFVTASIDVSTFSAVDISAIGAAIGSDVQNTATEFFTYYYSLDGGAIVNTSVVAMNAGDPVNYSIVGLDVSSASSLVVGINFNVDGVDDGYEIQSVVVSNPGPLPVTLTSFTAAATDAGARLTWEVAAQIDNDYFSVEVSRDGQTFESVGRVAGHGTSDSFAKFGYTHATSGEGTYYFRLQQVDYDGATSYSPVVALQLGTKAQLKLTSLAGERLQISNHAAGSYAIISMTGELLAKHDLRDQPAVLDISELPRGIYILSNGIESKRFVR